MQLSLFSVSYAGYWGQQALDTNAFIAKAAQLGYESVMLAGKRPHLSPLDMTAERIASVKQTLLENNISCSVIGGYTDLSPIAPVEIPYLQMQIAYVESLAALADELGASYVRVFTGYDVDGHNPQAVWNAVVLTLQEMCDRAAAYGVTIAIQNHHDLGLHSDALLELLGDIDRTNCRLGFDAWSPALRGEELYEAARKMAAYTAITTNADYIRFPRYRYQPELINYERLQPDSVRAVPFGEGFIDFEAFFNGMREGGFDGIATYEMCSPIRGGGGIENLDTYASQYVNWMKKQFAR